MNFLSKKRAGIFIALFILFFTKNSFASIGVTPTVTELVVAPGSEARGVFTVINDSEDSITVKIEPEEWNRRVDKNKGIPNIESWLFFVKNKVEIPPRSAEDVSYVVRMPKDFAGELSSQIYFSEISKKKEGMNIASRFGVVLYVLAEGTASYDLELEDLSIKDAKGDIPLIFTIRFKNKGNVHIRPNTTITILDESGKVLENFEVKYGPPVYGGNEREFNFAWKDSKLYKGKFKVVVKAAFKDKEILKESILFIDKDGSAKILN